MWNVIGRLIFGFIFHWANKTFQIVKSGKMFTKSIFIPFQNEYLDFFNKLTIKFSFYCFLFCIIIKSCYIAKSSIAKLKKYTKQTEELEIICIFILKIPETTKIRENFNRFSHYFYYLASQKTSQNIQPRIFVIFDDCT